MVGRVGEVVRMGSAFVKPAARQALWDSWDLCDRPERSAYAEERGIHLAARELPGASFL